MTVTNFKANEVLMKINLPLKNENLPLYRIQFKIYEVADIIIPNQK